MVAPTISSPVCQEQLVEAGKLVAKSVESCVDASQAAASDDQLLEQVGVAATAVTQALNDLLEHIKRHATGGQPVGRYDQATDTILNVTENIFSSMGDAGEHWGVGKGRLWLFGFPQPCQPMSGGPLLGACLCQLAAGGSVAGRARQAKRRAGGAWLPKPTEVSSPKWSFAPGEGRAARDPQRDGPWSRARKKPARPAASRALRGRRQQAERTPQGSRAP